MVTEPPAPATDDPSPPAICTAPPAAKEPSPPKRFKSPPALPAPLFMYTAPPLLEVSVEVESPALMYTAAPLAVPLLPTPKMRSPALPPALSPVETTVLPEAATNEEPVEIVISPEASELTVESCTLSPVMDKTPVLLSLEEIPDEISTDPAFSPAPAAITTLPAKPEALAPTFKEISPERVPLVSPVAIEIEPLSIVPAAPVDTVTLPDLEVDVALLTVT